MAPGTTPAIAQHVRHPYILALLACRLNFRNTINVMNDVATNGSVNRDIKQTSAILLQQGTHQTTLQNRDRKLMLWWKDRNKLQSSRHSTPNSHRHRRTNTLPCCWLREGRRQARKECHELCHHMSEIQDMIYSSEEEVGVTIGRGMLRKRTLFSETNNRG